MKFPTRENKHEGGEGGGSFLKLKDGDSVTGILRGDLCTFYAVGFGANTKIVGPGEGGRERFRHNIIVKEGDQYVAKIWEFGVKIYDDLNALELGGWDLQNTLITISRKGSTKENTKYTVTPLKKEPSPQAVKAMESVTLKTLEPKAPTEPPANESGDFESELPF